MMIYRMLLFTLILTVTACSNPLYHATSHYQHEEAMYADVAFLADDVRAGRATGTAGERASAAYIAERMRTLGLSPAGQENSYLQSFDYGGNPHIPITEHSTGVGYNVLGKIDNEGSEVIVIGAHYDHLGMGGFGSLHAGAPMIHNGADDNASGVAMLMELARTLKTQALTSDILFVAFSGEEYGLLGSNHFTKSILGNTKFKFMINMDMVGRLDDKRGLAVNGVGTSPVWPIVVDDSNKDNIKLIKSTSGSGPSDHSSFYHNQIPVLHFFTGQHADYHKPSDDIEKVNFDGMKKISGFIERVIVAADEFGEMNFAKTKDANQTNMSFKVTMGIMPDYLFDGEGLRIDGILPDRPAEKAGLLKGDVIRKIGQQEVKEIYSYMEALNQHVKGDKVEVMIKRGEDILLVPLIF